MKRGRYAVYKGIEYKAYERDGVIVLISESNIDGFQLNERTGKYMKQVTKDSLDAAYHVVQYAVYKGEKFYVLGEGNNEVFIGKEMAETDAQKLKFEFSGERDFYQGTVNINDVDTFIEDKDGIWGF